MSLDISLSDAKGNPIAEMNWSRNPFGLCDWMEDNVAYAEQSPHIGHLWHVINHWSYVDSDAVDRPLFKRIVEHYADVLEGMPERYFWFDVAQYMQFVQPNMHAFRQSDTYRGQSEQIVRIEGNVFHQHKIGLPMHYFEASCFYLRHPGMEEATLQEHYQNWMQRLVHFAELLQDPTMTFYCSN